MTSAHITLDASDIPPGELQLVTLHDDGDCSIRITRPSGVDVWLHGTLDELAEAHRRLAVGIAAARQRYADQAASRAEAIALAERAFLVDPHRPEVTHGPAPVDADPDGIACGVAV